MQTRLAFRLVVGARKCPSLQVLHVGPSAPLTRHFCPQQTSGRKADACHSGAWVTLLALNILVTYTVPMHATQKILHHTCMWTLNSCLMCEKEGLFFQDKENSTGREPTRYDAPSSGR